MGKQTQKPEKIIVLLTGATRGIGKAIALQLAQSGKVVIGTATSEAGAAQISDYLRQVNGEGRGYMLDVCDPLNLTELLDEIAAQWGPVSVLINNAGITRDNLLLRMKQEEWDDVLATNLTSIYRLSKHVMRTMLKARYGRIVNMASVVGVTGNPGQANYVAAKAGLIGFTKALALEMANYGITVNAVAPGFIQTDMTEHLSEKQKEMILGIVPMKKMGQPNDVAHAVNYLVSDGAAYVTGQTLHVNGGMCMV